MSKNSRLDAKKVLSNTTRSHVTRRVALQYAISSRQLCQAAQCRIWLRSLRRFRELQQLDSFHPAQLRSHLEAIGQISGAQQATAPSNNNPRQQTDIIAHFVNGFYIEVINNSELLTLTYGALVSQMVKDLENIDDVNKQLDRIGYNMGVRLIEDFLARTNSGRCMELRETADKLQMAFRMYLGMQPTVTSWSGGGDEFSLVWDACPLSEWVEIPPNSQNLRFCSLLTGAVRGALEMVQLEVYPWFVQDQLKGDSVTEMRVKYIRRLEDAIPAGED